MDVRFTKALQENILSSNATGPAQGEFMVIRLNIFSWLLCLELSGYKGNLYTVVRSN